VRKRAYRVTQATPENPGLLPAIAVLSGMPLPQHRPAELAPALPMPREHSVRLYEGKGSVCSLDVRLWSVQR